MRLAQTLTVAATVILVASCNPTKQAGDGNASSSDGSSLKALNKIEVKAGSGEEAALGDRVWVLYKGTLKNGTVFEENFDKGNVFSVELGKGGVIKGWDQGIPGMKAGGERKLEIPAALAYGAQVKDTIPPNSDLYFDIKLLYVMKPGDESVFDKTDTVVGTGPEAKAGDVVTFDYVGRYLNDTVFDDSKKRKPLTITLGSKKQRVIVGIDNGIRGMKAGGKRDLVLPPDLVYGLYGNGAIQGGQVCKFDISLISVNGQK